MEKPKGYSLSGAKRQAQLAVDVLSRVIMGIINTPTGENATVEEKRAHLATITTDDLLYVQGALRVAADCASVALQILGTRDPVEVAETRLRQVVERQELKQRDAIEDLLS